jgi:hypothetical protein
MRTLGCSLLIGVACFAGCSSNASSPVSGAAGGNRGGGGTSTTVGSTPIAGTGGDETGGTHGSAVAGSGGSTTGVSAGSGGIGAGGSSSGETTPGATDAGPVFAHDGAATGSPDGGGSPGLLPGSTSIFDGKTLDGWDGSNYWSVKDGAIDGLAQNGGELIVTKALYDNFRISGQARMVQSDNHLGVCFWGAKTGHGYGGCIDFVPPSGSIWDYGGGGGIRTLTYVWKGVPVDKHQWHQFEILANATTGTVRMGVDGHEFPVYHKAGRGKLAVIGLQIHAGFSEVAYKDLAVEVNPKEDRLLSVSDPPLPAP